MKKSGNCLPTFWRAFTKAEKSKLQKIEETEKLDVLASFGLDRSKTKKIREIAVFATFFSNTKAYKNLSYFCRSQMETNEAIFRYFGCSVTVLSTSDSRFTVPTEHACKIENTFSVAKTAFLCSVLVVRKLILDGVSASLLIFYQQFEKKLQITYVLISEIFLF